MNDYLPDHTAAIQATGYPGSIEYKPIAYCDSCKQEVYRGERMYRFEGDKLCPECFRDIVMDMPLDQLAAQMSVDIITPEVES